jgi:hypothetical protein
MYVYNLDDNKFNVGNIVYTANTRLPNEECYDGEIVQIVKHEYLGTYYVLLVMSHVDDFLILRKDRECFRSEEQYYDLTEQARQREDYYMKMLADNIFSKIDIGDEED